MNTFTFLCQGHTQDLAGGGAGNSFFRFIKFAAHGETMRVARGDRGLAPPRKFLKWCNFVCFGV